VVKKVSYSRDYITRLAREEKIFASQVGKNWFIDLESLINYEDVSKAELEIRKKQLSTERKIEKKTVEAILEKKLKRNNRSRKIKLKSVSVAAMVLGVGIMSGWSTYSFLINDYSPSYQMASTSVPPEFLSNNYGLSPTEDSALVSFSEVTQSVSFEQEKSTFNIRPIGDDVENGVLLLPYGSLTASATEMFSDGVAVLTSADGTEVVFRLGKDGRPNGNVMPFVTVPVNHLEI